MDISPKAMSVDSQPASHAGNQFYRPTAMSQPVSGGFAGLYLPIPDVRHSIKSYDVSSTELKGLRGKPLDAVNATDVFSISSIPTPQRAPRAASSSATFAEAMQTLPAWAAPSSPGSSADAAVLNSLHLQEGRAVFLPISSQAPQGGQVGAPSFGQGLAPSPTGQMAASPFWGPSPHGWPGLAKSPLGSPSPQGFPGMPPSPGPLGSPIAAVPKAKAKTKPSFKSIGRL